MKPGSIKNMQSSEGTRIEERDQEAKLLRFFEKLANRPEDERRRRLKTMVTEVYSWDDERIRAFTKLRLKVWGRIDQQIAQSLVASYDGVMEQMPADIALRRVVFVRSAVKELTAEEVETLRPLLPHFFPAERSAIPIAGNDTGPSFEHKAQRDWWAFWKSAS